MDRPQGMPDQSLQLPDWLTHALATANRTTNAPLASVLDPTFEGAAQGWNADTGASQARSWLDKNATLWPHALTHPAVAGYDLASRGLHAVLGGLQGANEGAGQAVGQLTGDPILGNDISAMRAEFPGFELAGLNPKGPIVHIPSEAGPQLEAGATMSAMARPLGGPRPLRRGGPPASLMGRPYVETMPTPTVPVPSAPQEIQQLQHEQRLADATGGEESRILRGRDALINQAVNQGKDLVNSPEFRAWKKGGRKGKPPTSVPPPPPAEDWTPPPAPPPSSFEDWSKAMAKMNDQANMTWDLEDVLGALRGGK
jgi:hypothetical protein